jgi:hypothetical protein
MRELTEGSRGAGYWVLTSRVGAGILGFGLMIWVWAWKFLATAALIDWCEVSGCTFDRISARRWDERFFEPGWGIFLALGVVILFLLSRRPRRVDSRAMRWLAGAILAFVWVLIVMARVIAPNRAWPLWP